jgi:DNA-binding response OmpR family regulator
VQIAILEDEKDDAALAVEALADAGHTIRTFTAGDALLAELRRGTFDLLLLDWNLPGLSGLEVTQWARTHLEPSPAIIMLTAREAADDAVAALEAGADDFIVKPVDPRVLAARVEAVARRVYRAPEGRQATRIAGYAFDPLTRTVTWAGGQAVLTDREFQLALILFRNLHRQLARAYLLETIWGWSSEVQTRTLDAHVSKVRRKLDLRPENGFRLTPVYSYGYRLERLDREGRASG